MLGWSLPIAKVFGVEVRLHSFFLFLLFLAMSWAGYLQRPLIRGTALWAMVLVAVGVRELARALGAAWFGLEVSSLLLLPTGAVVTYATPEATARAREPRIERWMAAMGPLANLLFGATMAALVLSVAPSVDLLSVQWVTPVHLLRALVWANLLLAAVHVLPAWPLDAARLVLSHFGPGEFGRATKSGADVVKARVLARMGPAIALGLIVVGVVSANFWMVMAGMSILLGAQLEPQAISLETSGGEVRVRDVMLTEYSILSASATLEDAVEQARHTLQDVFPVVRAGNMVGAVARRDVMSALGSTGNGYVQGIMTRTFETAAPEDSLMAMLARVTGQVGVSSQLVPVVEGERIVGIITPQNLQRSIRMVGKMLGREQGRGNERGRKREDEMD